MAAIGRVAYLGTGRFAVPLLERVAPLAAELLVVSQPDRPAGRGLRDRATPVAELARREGLRLVTPRRLASREGVATVRDFAPDGLLLAAYGQIVPPELLSVAPRPPLNVHPSLLPRHRGATPVPGTILSGDAEGGVTLIVMVAEVDAGPIVGQWRMPLTGREAAPDLEAALARLAADAVPSVLGAWIAGALEARPQDDGAATFTKVLRRSDGRIDWTASSIEIDRHVRAYQPWPGAWTVVRGALLHVRAALPLRETPEAVPGTLLPGDPPRVACGDGALELVSVQPAGRAAMPAADWARGLRGDGVILGAD